MEDFEWNVVNEGQLLEAMVGHKPVGVNKYFQMACIWDKFAEYCKEIESEKIWQHLQTMYNLEALDESESIPFPNSEKEFILPESEFGALIVKKDDEKKSVTKGRETPKTVKETTKKEDKEKPDGKTPKEAQRRDSKESKEKNPTSTKKELEKSATTKSSNKGKTPKEERLRGKTDDTPKTKRPLRNSLKPADDSGSSGKSSPVTVAPTTKRRRI